MAVRRRAGRALGSGLAGLLGLAVLTGTAWGLGATTSGASGADPACRPGSQLLGPATGYTEFVETDGSRSSESEGAIAYGGNLSMNGMTVAKNLSTARDAATLVVAGSHGQWFNLKSGSAYVVPRSGVNFNGGGGYLDTNPIDFAAAFASLRGLADELATAPATGTVAQGVAGGNTVWVLTGTSSVLNVFRPTAAQLADTAVNGFGFDVPAGSTVLVDLPDAPTLRGQFWLRQGGSWNQASDGTIAALPGILWNHAGSGTLTVQAGSAFPGSILAPRAHVRIQSAGHTMGQVVAHAFTSAYETHLPLFPGTACLPPGTPTGPAPRADVTLTKVASDPTPQGGEQLTWTLTARNTGSATATGVVLHDTLPAGLSLVSAAGCTTAGSTVTCPVGELAPGASATRDVVVLVAPVAGQGPSEDPQAHHWLVPWKDEQQVDLEPGETRTVSLTCADDGLLSDGSLRVDHVDQGTGVLGDVRVLSAQATGPGSWKAVVRNDATGRAQAKAYVVCLPARTEVADTETGHPDGHRHDLQADLEPATRTDTWAAGRHEATLSCPTGTTPVAPGFDAPAGGARLVSSEQGPDGTWTLGLELERTTTVTTSVRCLRTTVSATQGHTHDLDLRHVVREVQVPAGAVVEEQVICPDDAKGVVATFDVPSGVLHLGNDPRLKTRAFRLQNTTDQPLGATVDLVCLGDRTTTERMGTVTPVAIDNTATVTADDDADFTNDSATAGIVVQPGTATVALPRTAVARGRSLQLQALSSMPTRAAVRVQASGRTLATGRVQLDPDAAGPVAVRLTRAGRALLRHGDVVAQVRLVPARGRPATAQVQVG